MESPLLEWLRSRAGTLAQTPEDLSVVRDGLTKVAAVASIDHESAAVRARMIIEQLVCQVHHVELGDAKSKPLFEMIESLREKGKLPARIVSYLHTIRRIGDDAAHGQKAGSHAKITRITSEDFLAVLLPLLLVVEWYFCHFEKGPKCRTIYEVDAPLDLPASLSTGQTALEHADLIEKLIEFSERSPRDFKLELWLESEPMSGPVRDFVPDRPPASPHFRLGDRIVICARAEQDCLLWVIDVGTTGRNAIVFAPSPGAANHVPAGQVVRIPGTLAGKTGLETVYAFASKSPLPLRESSGRVRDFLAAAAASQDAAVRPACAVATIQFAIDESRESGSSS